ncbi:hypothetical protein AB8970_12750 [Yersinia enterocolitica]|uniref:hypothetical protein n=1 Tax=Yersinia enterocolitica TaxID=630 RepID=UPI0029A0A3F5|nr:hypothetical protein [Yersinia enterocolitica]HEI6851653.1 hypothetical protein [Yersinia enterocolitica]
MRKKIIQTLCVSVFFSMGLGYVLGRIYSFYHPMNSLEGYWEMNYDLNNLKKGYHVCSRVSILDREINSSADVYDAGGNIKARRNIIFSVLDVKENIFIGKVLSLSVVDGNDCSLNDFLNTPYAVSYPIFYQLNENTILVEQSQGHPVNSFRLLTRI